MRIAPVLLLAAALVAADEAPPPASPPVFSLHAQGGSSLSMSPDRPSEMLAVALNYEAVRIAADRIRYRITPYPGSAKAILATADFTGGPDGRVLIDTSASQLPQVVFRGVMRPSEVKVHRLDPDPARPGEVRFDADIISLGDFHGMLRTDKGEFQHIGWADRAVLRYVAALDPAASTGMGIPRMTDLYLYGRPAGDGQPARQAVILRMPKPVPDAEATAEIQSAAKTASMRGSGMAIAVAFDDKGTVINGLDEFEGTDLLPGGGRKSAKPGP